MEQFGLPTQSARTMDVTPSLSQGPGAYAPHTPLGVPQYTASMALSTDGGFRGHASSATPFSPTDEQTMRFWSPPLAARASRHAAAARSSGSQGLPGRRRMPAGVRFRNAGLRWEGHGAIHVSGVSATLRSETAAQRVSNACD